MNTEVDVNIEIPLFSSYVPCGFPSPADDYLESPIDLNEHLIRRPAATFFVRAKGESMVGAGIFDGDLIVIDRSIDAQHGHIVLASINGEFTLKRLIKNGVNMILQPENSKHSPIVVNEESDFKVWGVVAHSIRKHI